MANFFYYDSNNTKQGPVPTAQLKALAQNGTITPDTFIDTDIEGIGKIRAGTIKGLSFPQPPAPESPAPEPPTPQPPTPQPPTPQPFTPEPFTPQPFTPEPLVPCPHCGASIAAGERFCGICGKSVFATHVFATPLPTTPFLPPSAPCPHCGASIAAGERFCGICGKSPNQAAYTSAYSTNTPSFSVGGFLDIGFTRFITPIYISVIWVICIVSDVLSFLASLFIIGNIASAVSESQRQMAGFFGGTHHEGPAAGIFIIGLIVSIIVHLLLLLFSRLLLETIIVLFKIEEHTRITNPK